MARPRRRRVESRGMDRQPLRQLFRCLRRRSRRRLRADRVPHDGGSQPFLHGPLGSARVAARLPPDGVRGESLRQDSAPGGARPGTDHRARLRSDQRERSRPVRLGAAHESLVSYSRRRRPARRLLLAALLAVPGVPAIAEPTIPELVEVADIGSLSASPSGRQVVFRVERASIARNSYDLDWYVADLQTGAARRIADGGAPIEGGL